MNFTNQSLLLGKISYLVDTEDLLEEIIKSKIHVILRCQVDKHERQTRAENTSEMRIEVINKIFLKKLNISVLDEENKILAF